MQNIYTNMYVEGLLENYYDNLYIVISFGCHNFYRCYYIICKHLKSEWPYKKLHQQLKISDGIQIKKIK